VSARRRTHPETADDRALALLSAPALAQCWLTRRAMLRRYPSPEALEMWVAAVREVDWRRGVSAC